MNLAGAEVLRIEACLVYINIQQQCIATLMRCNAVTFLNSFSSYFWWPVISETNSCTEFDYIITQWSLVTCSIFSAWSSATLCSDNALSASPTLKRSHVIYGTLYHHWILTVPDEMACSSVTLLSSLALLPSWTWVDTISGDNIVVVNSY